jgi:hypothetical protein
MSMYRSYLLKNEFWAKKGGSEKEFIKHDEAGGIYATIINEEEKKGVKIITDGNEYFFNNFDKLDAFLRSLRQRQDDFLKILKRRTISHKLRMLEL